VECALGDLVCLHLDAHAEAYGRTPAPRALTAAGVGDALEVDDEAVARIRLVDSLDTLVEEGLVDRTERSVEARAEPRTVYELTGAGHERAAAVREQLADQTVAVTDGSPGADASGAVPLSEVGDLVESTTDPMVTAVARLRREQPVTRATADEPRFVGRSEPLSAVVEAVEASRDRGSRTVVLSGDAGMGKTALVREAVDRVGQGSERPVLARGAAQPDAGAPYAPLRQAFESVPGGAEIVGQLGASRDAVTPEEPEAVEAQRTAMFNDVADALREASTDRQLVVFVDNLQWADEATLALFAHLATSITEWLYPVTFVGAYRRAPVAAADDHSMPTVLDRIERGANYTGLELGPLSREETRALVARSVGRHELPDAFVDAVHERTGGVPLLVTGTVSHLMEADVVDPTAERYPSSGDAFGVPVEVVEQVDRRLDRLDEPSRELLRVAAVLGEYVERAVLAASSDLPPARRREYVDLLVASRLLETDDANDCGDSGDLRFVSGLFREAVVESLPSGEAAGYHERVAEALLSVHDDDAGDRASEVAHHLERAGQPARAVEHYRRAGEHARSTYANDDAVDAYRRALDLAVDEEAVDGTTGASVATELADVHASVGAFEAAVDTVGEGLALAGERSQGRCDLLDVRCQVELRRGELDAAETTASSMRDLAVDLGASDLKASALRKLGNVARKRDEYDRAERCDRESLAISRETGDREGEARSHINLGVVLFMQGDLEGASEQYRQSVAIKRELGDRQGEGRVLGNLGLVEMRRGDLEAAREYQEESLAAFREVGDRHGAARTLGNLGVVARRQLAFDAARDYYEEALSVFREVGDALGQARTLGNLGTLAYRQSDYDTAVERHRESLALKREVGDRSGVARTLNNLGFALSDQGSFEAAREQYQESLERSREIGDPEGEARSQKNLGWVATGLGAFDVARDHLEESLETFRELGDRSGEGYALKHLARVAHGTGDHELADQRYLAAIDALEDASEHHPVETTRLNRGVLALDRGDLETATGCLEESLDLFETIGDRKSAAFARGHLGLVDLRSGDRVEGRAAVATALETLRSVGATPARFRLLRHAIGTERALGADERARDLGVDAERALDRHGRSNGHQAEQLAALCADLADGR
jgi:tetratricopeptide (TPR) repeat protein